MGLNPGGHQEGPADARVVNAKGDGISCVKIINKYKMLSSVSHKHPQNKTKPKQRHNFFFPLHIFAATVHRHMVIPLCWHSSTVKCVPPPSLPPSRSPAHVPRLVFPKVGQPSLSNIRLLGVAINQVTRPRGQMHSVAAQGQAADPPPSSKTHTHTHHLLSERFMALDLQVVGVRAAAQMTLNLFCCVKQWPHKPVCVQPSRLYFFPLVLSAM